MNNKDLLLGKKAVYEKIYNPNLLFPIERENKRKAININSPMPLPFSGVDIWNAYEMSWLDEKGKPIVAIGKFIFLCTSPYIIESKSMKLYLNSFNQTAFKDIVTVTNIITKDLSDAVLSDVKVELYPMSEVATVNRDLTIMEGECIDEEDISIKDYQPNPSLLKVGNKLTKNVLYSNLLKSNCLVTGQPDWASIQVAYSGYEIDKIGLLKYIVSFREHSEFHEQCVERIFMDIMSYCKPDTLSILAKYTRRGGLDINPFRSTFLPNIKITRDIRQ
jgi:7-cyano-7-deazaguanine reductase